MASSERSIAGSRDSRTYMAFAGAMFIGGANFIAVSFSNMELPPLFGATVRFAVAALLFFAVARVARVPVVRGREAIGAAVYGVLGFGIAYALLYYALLGLPAGTVSVVVAAVPMITFVIATLLRQEPPTVRKVAASAIVIIGIAILSTDSLGGGTGGSFLLAALLATVAISASSVVAKALPNVHPINMNAVGMGTGSVLLALGSLLWNEQWALPRESSTWLAVAWLVFFGSIGLFQLFLYVVRRWSASATVYAVAGMPVVAAVLGVLLLDQPVTPAMFAGGSLVLLAIYLGAVTRGRPTTTVAAEEGAV